MLSVVLLILNCVTFRKISHICAWRIWYRLNYIPPPTFPEHQHELNFWIWTWLDLDWSTIGLWNYCTLTTAYLGLFILDDLPLQFLNFWIPLQLGYVLLNCGTKHEGIACTSGGDCGKVDVIKCYSCTIIVDILPRIIWSLVWIINYPATIYSITIAWALSTKKSTNCFPISGPHADLGFHTS